MIINTLEKHDLIKPPSWLGHSVQLLCQGGSVAYGMKTEDSDIDCIGLHSIAKLNHLVILKIVIS